MSHRKMHVPSTCARPECGQPLDKGYRYIYPVPEPYADPLRPRRVGIRVCLDCHPAMLRLQIEQGLIEPTEGEIDYAAA